MTDVLSIRPLKVYPKVSIEIQEEDQKVKNILFLLMVLIGVNGSRLLEEQVQSSSSKIEALKANHERRQAEIDGLNDKLKNISKLYDELNEAGRNLEDLSSSERHAYFEKSRKLQNAFEDIQTQVQIKMKNTSTVMQEIVRTSKIDVEPLKQFIEALQNMGSKLSELFSTQWGNNIQLRK